MIRLSAWTQERLGMVAFVAALGVAAVLPSMMQPTMAQMGISNPTAVPLPSNMVPPSETVGGGVGSDVAMYALPDHTHPRITRVAVVNTDASGNWAVTWSSALAATPGVFAIPVNAGSMPVTCNVTTRTTTTAAGKCWTAQTTLLNLSIITAGLTLTPYNNSLAGIPVQVIAVPTTQ